MAGIIAQQLQQAGTADAVPSSFDQTVALARLDQDQDLLAEVTALFLAELPGTLEQLRQAASSADWTLLRRLAHGLKSTAAIIGAEQATQLARELEATVSQGHPIEAGLTALLAELEQLNQTLRQKRRITK